MSYSAYSSELVVKHLFTTDVVTRPTSWTAHLYTGDPEGMGVEFTDSGYAAQAVAFAVGDADSNGRSEASNDAPVAFPAIVDGEVTAEYVVVKDNASNIIASVQLTPPRPLGVGGILSLPTGGLVIKGE